ncbi:hypothetical protein [Streptomonospora wellingtoniae]|uniref:Uncharacterized protein n=1 Tax=Streptomonospora wellingtoniae TaxID=3075544 RepID=A0ABU2KUF4_9ACTN|nr:hypothetical protein [Streptomonospora sp. DSM 45055]MDT0302924.1 hypothetical protein [Streptomonospora sp. DSM 45055]
MSDLRDRIADALASAAMHPDPDADWTDAVMGVVGPEIAARENSLADMRALEAKARRERDESRAALARARTDLAAEIDDMDPDHTMRNGITEHTPDQGHPGNSWWRAYCEVGGMMRALAAIDEARSSNE